MSSDGGHLRRERVIILLVYIISPQGIVGFLTISNFHVWHYVVPKHPSGPTCHVRRSLLLTLLHCSAFFFKPVYWLCPCFQFSLFLRCNKQSPSLFSIPGSWWQLCPRTTMCPRTTVWPMCPRTTICVLVILYATEDCWTLPGSWWQFPESRAWTSLGTPIATCSIRTSTHTWEYVSKRARTSLGTPIATCSISAHI